MLRTAFIGVRISWLMVARNALFARLAASAASFAATSSASSRLYSVMSWVTPHMSEGFPSGPRTTRPAARIQTTFPSTGRR